MKNNKKSFKAFIVFLIYFFGLYFQSLFVGEATTNKTLINEIKVISINLIIMVVLTAVFFQILKNDWFTFKNNFKKISSIGIKYWILGAIAMATLNIIAYNLVPEIAQNEEANRNMINSLPFSTIFSVLFFAPFVEEIVYRLNIKNASRSIWSYLIYSSLFFGFIHMSSGITSVVDVIHLLSYSSLGFAFAFTHHKTNTIFTSMFTHGLHNLVGLIILFL